MFSSFEALWAESLGQKVTFSRSPAVSDGNTRDPAAPVAADAVKFDGPNKGNEVSSSSQPTKKPENRRRMRGAKLAPEFDGLHCFETIIPY